MANETTVLIRLGRVLYWGFAVLAIPFAGMAVFAMLAALGIGMRGDPSAWIGVLLFAGAAVVVWGIGRAARYVLAAE